MSNRHSGWSPIETDRVNDNVMANVKASQTFQRKIIRFGITGAGCPDLTKDPDHNAI